MSNRMSRENASFLISVFYKEHGPFNLEELALRAAKREFGWDMFAYRLPKDNIWRSVRVIPELREILLKNFPLQAGDEGPAGGRIFKNKSNKLIEISPADAGYCPWENAENVCKNFSFNGYNDWRLPTPDELTSSAMYISEQVRYEKNIPQTDEFILHWSNQRKGESATAVFTCIDEDDYKNGTLDGYYKNRDDIEKGYKKQLPVTEWHPVRPVREVPAI